MSAWIEITPTQKIIEDQAVALLVSAWIEICVITVSTRAIRSRTPRECVDWNNPILLDRCAGICRTPRECVDWNGTLSSRGMLMRQSHSSWVRGLKSRFSLFRISRSMSHSSWVRGLKCQRTTETDESAASHSSWVRGLKCDPWPQCNRALVVALLVSAWIEITEPELRTIVKIVALLVSAWIEIGNNSTGNYHTCCRTPRECVDWNNTNQVQKGRFGRSHSSWVRGLK